MTEIAQNKKSFILYSDLRDTLIDFSIEDKGHFFNAILDYQNNFPINLPPHLIPAFSFLKTQFSRDTLKYEKSREEKTTFGKMGNLKRWHFDLYKKVVNGEITLEEAEQSLINKGSSLPDQVGSPPIGSVANVAVSVSDSVSVKNKKIPKKKNQVSKVFQSPTLEDVIDYCKGRSSSVDPVSFFEYYNAGNWKDSLGNQVKNWKQKVITWENKKDKTPRGGQTISQSNTNENLCVFLNNLMGDSLITKIIVSTSNKAVLHFSTKTDYEKLRKLPNIEEIKNKITSELKTVGFEIEIK